MEQESDSSLSRFEHGSHNESKIDQKIDQVKNNNLVGSILFSQNPLKKKKPFNWIRIRSFLIKHTKFGRLMEFSCHPGGIHLLRLAVFHSENGCKMCKVYVEKNLF